MRIRTLSTATVRHRGRERLELISGSGHQPTFPKLQLLPTSHLYLQYLLVTCNHIHKLPFLQSSAHRQTTKTAPRSYPRPKHTSMMKPRMRAQDPHHQKSTQE